ncbi:MAG: hypothetical protein ABSG41_06560 [Bryobacteraceae bacterium]|jgi:hypothetical protein
MATLATFFRVTSAKEASANKARRESIRAQSDPFRLRALPNDDIYFYSKKIDNSRVVRQADPEARGECWSAVGAAGVLLMLGVSIIAPHVGAILAGYKLEALKAERQTLIDQKRDLEVREAGLLSPARLNNLARARSLTSPASDQVIHLDNVPSVDGSFAQVRPPASGGPVPAQLSAR